MKRSSKYLKRVFKTIDVSPFSYSTGKVIIFLIWGLNALVFLSKDSIIDNNAPTEQLRVVSREFFDNIITPDPASFIDINIIPFVVGIVIDPGYRTCDPFEYTFNPNRAPPAIS